jgi:hypothetical protein
MKHVHSSTSIFLMEIILNILLFCVLLVVGLQFFLQTHKLTTQTRELHQAVTSCENIAALFQNGDGSLDALTADCTYSIRRVSEVDIYLDDTFTFCQRQDASYYVTAVSASDKDSALSKLQITCYTMEKQELYTLTACRYTPLENARAGTPEQGVT